MAPDALSLPPIRKSTFATPTPLFPCFLDYVFFALQCLPQLKPPCRLIEQSARDRHDFFRRRHDLDVADQVLTDESRRAFR
jgi:hypothetical protein